MSLCRQHHDGGGKTPLAQLAADLEAILMGKHHIEQDQVECFAAGAPDGLHAVCHDCNLVPLRLQVTLEAESYAGFVFNDLDLGHSTPLSLINPMTALEGVPIMAVGDRRREQDAAPQRGCSVLD